MAILRAVRRDLFAEKEQFFYEVTFGWPGMPTQTKLVDVGQKVSVGTEIKIDGHWWVVEQVAPRGRRAPRTGQGEARVVLAAAAVRQRPSGDPCSSSVDEGNA